MITSADLQSWSPRGHGLGLEAPRGQPIVSLALASKVKSLASATDAKSLALALTLKVKSLALAFRYLFPVLVLGFEPKSVNSPLKAMFLYQQSWGTTSDLYVSRPAVSRLTQTTGKLCSMSHSSPSCTASFRGSSAHLLPQHQWNMCSVTVVSSWDQTEREWGGY